MYLAISALGMSVTALLSYRLGTRFLSYAALFLGAVTSVSLLLLTMIGIGQEFFSFF